MSMPSTEGIVENFTRKLNSRLDPNMLEEPVRLDNTHTVVIISVKDRGRIHAHINGGINDQGLANVIEQIETVPSLKGLVLPA
jgi:hypothetical protein